MEDFSFLKRKPKTQKGKKYLAKKKGQLQEGPKLCLMLRGNKTSKSTMGFMKDVYMLKKQNSKLFKRKHMIKPFNDPSSLEFLLERNNSALFILMNHSKKRPHNMILGRTFDNQILDMVEMGIEGYIGLEEFKTGLDLDLNARPIVMFQGDVWSGNSDYERIQNLLNDFWVANITLDKQQDGFNIRSQISHMVVYLCQKEGTIEQRIYRILLTALDQENPEADPETGAKYTKLIEMGPRATLQVRRMQLASDTVFKMACKQPKVHKKRHLKNVKTNSLGQHMGRIYVEQQALKTLQLKKRKSRRTVKDPKEEKNMLDQ